MLDAATITLPPGMGWCRAWTAAIDEALRGWLPPSGGLAVVGLGSYARQELCRASDIDLLFLHDGWREADLTELVQSICYPLWDAGLSVGHTVRTPREAVRSAGERVDTATALTDRRLIAGAGGLLEELAVRMRRWLRRNSARVLDELATLDAQRHARRGDAAGMLEPDLKNGVGGLRDLHSLRWAGACVLGEVGLDPLVGARYLGATDRRELAQAGTTLLEARSALHLVTGRGSGRPGADRDRLRLDLQDEVAARLSLPGGGDELLHRVGLATRTIAYLHSRTWPLLLADARGGRRRQHPPPQVLDDGIRLVDGLVEVDAARTLTVEPSLGLRAIAAAALQATHLGRASAIKLQRELAQLGTLRWDATSREALLTTLRQGWNGVSAMGDADSIGLLIGLLPDWERLRGLPQRNPLHRYDVDTHGLVAVAELVAIAGGALDPGQHRGSGTVLPSAIWAGLDDNARDAALLGTWLHDVGKGLPGDHSVAGGRLAREWMLHMGFTADLTARVGRLVRWHLLLPDVATRRDLDDPDEIRTVARRVVDVETLDGLYLLSLADSRATGPAAWSAWKDQLLTTLHQHVRRMLVDDAKTQRHEQPTLQVAVEARALLSPHEQATGLDALLGELPSRYLRIANAEQIAEHARLLLPLPRPGTLRARHRPGPAMGTTVVTVVAGDRLGLMADCAGVLASHGLGVLDARLFTRSDGVVLDWFVVRDAPHVRWDKVVDDLRRAGAGDLDVAAAVARRERRRDERPPPLAAPISVEVRIDTGRVEIRGPDRPGVLYRLARVLADAGLDVAGARIDTLGPLVHDVFFTHGEPPPDLVCRIHAIYR